MKKDFCFAKRFFLCRVWLLTEDKKIFVLQDIPALNAHLCAKRKKRGAERIRGWKKFRFSPRLFSLPLVFDARMRKRDKNGKFTESADDKNREPFLYQGGFVKFDGGFVKTAGRKKYKKPAWNLRRAKSKIRLFSFAEFPMTARRPEKVPRSFFMRNLRKKSVLRKETAE